MDEVFIPGLRLAGEFYAEVVRPLLGQEFPGLRYAAALLGPGSEVLGFDTERSTDHDWGPRLQVFLGADDAERHAAPITEMLAERLPSAFRGCPVAFRVPRDEGGGARHRVRVTELGGMADRAPRIRSAARRDAAGLARDPISAFRGGYRGCRIP